MHNLTKMYGALVNNIIVICESNFLVANKCISYIIVSYARDSATCANGTADIIFILDASSCVTEVGYEWFKQLASDISSMLPANASVRVAMVSFTTHATTVFGFTNTWSTSDILQHRYTGW